MTASFVRRALARIPALAALAPLSALLACGSPLVTASEGAGNVRFAVAAEAAGATDVPPVVRVGRTRVLGRGVNVQEPVVMSADRDGSVNVTFAQRQHAGLRLAMDPSTLASRSETPFVHASHPRPSLPPSQAGEPLRAPIRGGGSLVCWNDEPASRLLVQRLGPDGASRGAPIAISLEGIDVFGAPQVASVDGRRFVVSFFTCHEDGFDLVATSLDVQD